MKKPIFRILVNTPSTFGGIGATTALAPSLTLGCGTWGGSSVSENVTPLNLINIKRVAWPIRKVEWPGVESLQPHESAPVSDPRIDPGLVQEIVSRVLKGMNDMNTKNSGCCNK